MSTLMPAIFIGHGNPMITLSKNAYTEAWAKIGGTLPHPKAVVVVSAHWYITGSAVTADDSPRTIHDFGGFPQVLHDVQYPAPGYPELARQVKELLSPVPVGLDETWGLDHGTWTVLRHIFPKADIPVVQLSIDKTKPPVFHYELGKRLKPLREEGVLVIGSGNLVHNLRAYSWGDSEAPPFDWAANFEHNMRNFMRNGKDMNVVAYEELGEDAARSVPSPDHFLPLLYILGLRREDEQINFPIEGFDGGSMSMLSVRVG
ncbi:MAG: 4,5-DOPA dioxygenase extradiol [Desulfuromonadaceae bacterium]|nr:4,5-DOPA dioxygenase extradiol [Desulfuromonadaceae bacterium]